MKVGEEKQRKGRGEKVEQIDGNGLWSQKIEKNKVYKTKNKLK